MQFNTIARRLRGSFPFQIIRIIPLLVLVPLSMAVFGDFNGDTVSEAFANSIDAFIHSSTLWLFWPILALGVAAVFLYIGNTIRCACGECDLSGLCRKDAEKIIKKLDHLHAFVIGVCILAFFAGGSTFIGPFGEEQGKRVIELYVILLAVSKGLLCGVIISFNLENILYPARKAAIALYPDIKLRKTSLYRKVYMIIFSIVFFLVMQLVNTTAIYYAGALQGALPAASPSGAAGTAAGGADAVPPLIPPAAQEAKAFITQKLLGQEADSHALDKLFNPDEMRLRGTLGVFVIKIGLYAFYVLLLMIQVKGLVKRPLLTIKGRLGALTSSEPQDSRIIDILTNDEYAEVYGEINTLINRQRRDLECSSHQLEMIVDQAADPIVSFTDDNVIRVFNPAAERFFGYSASEVVGGSMLKLVSLPPGEDLVSHMAESGSGMRRFTGLRKDGSSVAFEGNLSVMRDSQRMVYTAIIRDISKQLEIEAALTQAKVAAENANRLKGEFLANMSHELRTPLNAVLGFTQLLSADSNLTSGQLEKIGIVSRSGEHLLSLINDILDISKIEAGKLELHPSAFNLRRFVSDLKEMFSLRCRKSGLSLYVEYAGEVPENVVGDLGKLRQVMINLVGNAVKFTSEGGIGIVVGKVEGGIRFSVTDSGKGIPADEIDLILQPFTQSSVTDNEGGTGLGLAISSRFISMMGGKLEVRSELGKGSTFSFTVDLPETDQEIAAPEAEPVAVAVKPGSQATALIVDDKELNRLVLKEMLEAAGFGTIEAENGKVAVERARELMPRIVFMDIKMPVMDGYQAVKALKDDPATSGIKVFALTASAFINDERKILASGFDGFLAKPFKRSDLFRLIREKSGIELEYERAPERGQAPEVPAIEDIDFAQAREAMGPDAVAELSDAVQINDFSLVRSIVERLGGRGSGGARIPQGLAALAGRAADAFDDDCLSRIVSGLQEAGE